MRDSVTVCNEAFNHGLAVLAPDERVWLQHMISLGGTDDPWTLPPDDHVALMRFPFYDYASALRQKIQEG